jgi:hypothetical protein
MNLQELNLGAMESIQINEKVELAFTQYEKWGFH